MTDASSTKGKLIVFSAPSGSGKTTIVRHLLEQFDDLAFSVSATSRPPRGQEQHGVDYFFLDPETFRSKIEADEFLEWEEVYSGTHYGTLKSEVERLWSLGKTVAFDVDVEGGIHLKNLFGDRALTVFVKAPSREVLRQRLEKRGTDDAAQIERRLAKADHEATRAENFDLIIVNDDLETAKAAARDHISKFIGHG